MQFPEFSPEEEEPVVPVSLYCEEVELPTQLPDIKTLTTWIERLAREEGVALQELSFIFCTDDYLLQINQEYLQHDYYTDVITFQLSDGALHGDIFISVDRVADNASQIGTPFDYELLRVIVHGVLHLAGYRDKTAEEEATMRMKENYYLELL